jgi:hypothetical protein
MHPLKLKQKTYLEMEEDSKGIDSLLILKS